MNSGARKKRGSPSEETRRKISETKKRRYATGTLVTWNKGKTGVYPKEVIEKNRLAHLGKPSGRKGVKGLPLTKEIKIKISSALKGRIPWNKGRKGSVAWNKGITHTDETRQKMKIAHTGMKHSKETKEKIRMGNVGNFHSEETKAKISERRLKQIFPFKNTSIEVIMQNALNKNRIAFETHISILGQPDIFIEPNICIFCDGCYWHGCDLCKIKMSPLHLKKSKTDEYVTTELEKKGYVVLRFWEHEIRGNPEECVKKILQKL